MRKKQQKTQQNNINLQNRKYYQKLMTEINNIWYNITTNNKKTLNIKTQRKIAIKQPKKVVKEVPK